MRARGRLRETDRQLRADQLACKDLLRQGSKSFAAAALLLPQRVREPVTSLYAFCRQGDDAVDEATSPSAGLEQLQRRLELVYLGRPLNTPVDRAFTRVVEQFWIPRRLPDALLEGFQWDLAGRRYETLSDLRQYAARVASTVGVMMTLLMGRRDPEVLARASELGLAMQLTNIARDVGEDARRGRLYLPQSWLREEGLEPDVWLSRPTFDPPIARAVERLIAEAEQLYLRADQGVPLLPWDCRAAIWGARLIYADIGRSLQRAGWDSITDRAYTSWRRKLWLLARACGRSLLSSRLLGKSQVPAPPPFAETQFLVSRLES